MNSIDLVNEKIFRFPLNGTDYFHDHLNETFGKYLQLLTTIDDEHKELVSRSMDKISNTCASIIQTNDLVFRGQSSKANALFANIMECLKEYLLPKDKNVVITDLDTHLFKARKVLEKDFGINDMFHVPFEKRYTTKTNRFSISGVPCLYLSNSIYTCWEELDRPLFSQMAISKFKAEGKNFRYLDLSTNLIFLRSRADFKGDDEKTAAALRKVRTMIFEKFINVYPLYVACYTKVFFKNADFKPEYVFPQMLMEWALNSDDIDGVVYESTKTKTLKQEHSLNLKEFLNFAIPVRTNSKKGFCSHISKYYKLTQPTSWEMINILDPEFIASKPDFEKEILGKIMPPPPILIINDIKDEKPIFYPNTSFGRLEQLLFTMPLFSVE